MFDHVPLPTHLQRQLMKIIIISCLGLWYEKGKVVILLSRIFFLLSRIFLGLAALAKLISLWTDGKLASKRRAKSCRITVSHFG